MTREEQETNTSKNYKSNVGMWFVMTCLLYFGHLFLRISGFAWGRKQVASKTLRLFWILWQSKTSLWMLCKTIAKNLFVRDESCSDPSSLFLQNTFQYRRPIDAQIPCGLFTALCLTLVLFSLSVRATYSAHLILALKGLGINCED